MISSKFPLRRAVAYTWDNNGNLTARGNDSFAWDAEDRLVSATVGGVTTSFAYPCDGLRHSRTTGGSTATFTWDVGAGLPQVLDDGAFRYVYGIGRIAAVGPGTTTHYYLADGLASVMALTDATGAVVNAYDYDVFGAVRSQSGSQANEFTFAGEQVDGSTGLQYLRARYYDMATGRFVSRDKFEGFAMTPQTLQGFTYAYNSPVTHADPSGNCPQCACAVGAVAGPIGVGATCGTAAVLTLAAAGAGLCVTNDTCRTTATEAAGIAVVFHSSGKSDARRVKSVKHLAAQIHEHVYCKSSNYVGTRRWQNEFKEKQKSIAKELRLMGPKARREALAFLAEFAEMNPDCRPYVPSFATPMNPKE